MKPKLTFLFLSFLLFISSSCQQNTSSSDDLIKELHAIFEADKGPDEDRENRPLFRDVSIAKNQKEADKAKFLLERLHKIDKSNLPKGEKINYDMFEYILNNRIMEAEYESYLMPINAEGGFHTGFQMRMSRANFRKEKDIEKYIERLNGFKTYVEQNIALMREGVKKGVVPPRVILKNYAPKVRPFASGQSIESPFYKPFKKMPDWVSGEKQHQYQQAAQQAISESVMPAFQSFDEFMQNEYLPNAKAEVGAQHLPKGKAFYEERIKYFTTLEMTAEEVYQKGEEEVARIRAEMEAIIEELGFEGSFADFLAFLRTDEQFYAKTPKELLSEASYLSKRIDAKLPTYFNRLPRNTYGVAPVPDAIAPTYTGGRYVPGSLEDHRSGTYWVNTYKLESRPLYVLPSLTLHEAVPGHHLQISLAEEMEGLPDFRNNYYISAFGEGWALYTEWLGKEAGMYETPYQDFGRLTYEMWRACRLVVDVGLHVKGWKRQQAIDFMASNTALSMHEVTTEIDRYIGWPGQAVSYKIGELKIRELRKIAEEELGEKFDLRDFHDVILANGSVPLFILEDVVTDFIQSKKE